VPVRSSWFNSVVAVSAFSLTICLLNSANGVPAGASESSRLLTQAYQQTAAGDLAAADATYREMLVCCPEEGYPALARFLSKSGQTTAVETLLTQDPAFATQSVLTRARSFISAGKRVEAVQLLKHDAGTTGSSYARALLLSNQLETIGENDASVNELELALRSADISDADRRDLFMRLLQVAGPADLTQLLLPLVDTIVTSTTIGYLQTRSLALDGLTAVSMGNGYADLHAKLEQAAKTSPSHAWLYSLSCLKKGDEATALAALDTLSSATLTPRQKAFCFEELARMVALDTPRAISLYEQVIPVSDDPERIRLNLAQQHFRAKNLVKVVEMLKAMDFQKLHDGDHQTALNLYLTSLGSVGPMPDLVSEFLRLSSELPYEKVRDISPAPFIMFSPDNLEALRSAVDKVTAETSGSEKAYLLLMGLENQIGNNDGITKALESYTMANPDDANAAHELADALSAKAWRIVADNPETSPTLAELEVAGNAASRALWNAVRLRPYAPEPYIKLIALYKLYNQPDKAAEVPRFLSDSPNATAEEVHLAAFIYATQGYPDLSIPLYERALRMQDETRFRLNYAAALGRIERYEDAMKIYREIIAHGVNGHQYHVHEVHSSALALARRQGQEKQHLNFLNSLLTNPNVPDRAEFLLEEGKVLASAGLYQEALKFFYQYKEEYPDDTITATDIIVSTYAVMKDFDTARRLLTDEIARTTSSEQLAFLKNNYALTYRLQGQIDTAVSEWQKLAEDHPAEQMATRALLNAARALAQTGQISQARQFYNQFVKLNTGDVTGEQIARDELARLDRMEVPTDMLVQSAILEYGPGNVDHDHGFGFDHFETGQDKIHNVPATAVAQEDDHDDHDDHADSEGDKMRPLRLDLGREHDTTDTKEILHPQVKH